MRSGAPGQLAALVVGLVLATSCVVGTRSATSAQTASPSVRLVSMAPLTLRGAGFRADERVRVTLTVRVRHASRIVRADGLGRFIYRPAKLVAVDPCTGTIVVRAVGLSSGRQATWKRDCRRPDEWP
jgi:hypothetical protein